MNEPLWKLALNWGVVITFLSLPLVLMMTQLAIVSHPNWISDPQRYEKSFGYLSEFQRNLAILIFGLAGLHTWEQVRNGKNDRINEKKSIDKASDK
jgi:hypothetical protein